MVSYFPFDFNHIRREVHPLKIPLLCAKAVLQLLAGYLPQTAQCSRFFHTLWHLLKEG